MSQDLFDLRGKVAVVTGGTTGLGHALSLGLAGAGADVVPSSRRLEQVKKVATEIEALGRRSLRITSDVKNRDSLQAFHDAVLKEFGKVDILVNAAGITDKAATLEADEADWSRRDRYQLDRYAARMPDFWRNHGSRRIRADHEHRFVDIICRILSSGRIRGEQSRGGFADQGIGSGTGAIRRECECDRARSFSYPFECFA